MNEVKPLTLEQLQQIMEYRNKNNNFSNLIGLRVYEMTTGTAKSRMKVTEAMGNPIGSIHGGALYTVADVTAGAAVSSHGMMVTTMNSSMNYLRPAIGCTELYGEAEEIKHGRRASVVSVWIKDQNGTELAQGTFTFMSLGKPIEFE